LAKWGRGLNKMPRTSDIKSSPGDAATAQKKIEYLQSLVDATRLIHSSLDLQELLSIILKIAIENTHAEAGTIYLLDKEKNEIWSKVSDSDGVIDIRLPIGEGIAGYVAQTGKIVNITDAYSHPKFTAHFDKVSGFRTRTMLCLPMRDEFDNIIGVFQIMNKRNGIFEKEDEEFLSDLSVHAALAINKAYLHSQVLEKQKIETELSIARNIQQRLLPKQVPEIPGYDFAATNLPSEMVGGDYYDFFPSGPRQLSFTIGDVSGKGIPASLLMATLRTGMHAKTTYCKYTEPSEFITQLNQLIYNSALPSQFITVFYAELQQQSGSIEFINAGHNPPLHIKNDGTEAYIGTNGISLGLMPHAAYQSRKMTLNENEILFLYTDGITEAMDSHNNEFGEERLLEVLRKNRYSPAKEIMEQVIQNVSEFVGDSVRNDDMTIVVIKREKKS